MSSRDEVLQPLERKHSFESDFLRNTRITTFHEAIPRDRSASTEPKKDAVIKPNMKNANSSFAAPTFHVRDKAEHFCNALFLLAVKNMILLLSEHMYVVVNVRECLVVEDDEIKKV